MEKYIYALDEVSLDDISTVGGKNASLGEMIQHLTSLGINIPKGFVSTQQHIGVLLIQISYKLL